jgi:hypothetical protein
MPSSTSSFRRRACALQDAAHLAFGVFTAVALGAAAHLLAAPGLWAADIVAYRRPPDRGSFYLAHDRGGHVDHHVLYHGIDEHSLARMRESDMLFLGNSRLMFALPGDVLRRFFEARGLSYYVLGFGHEEQDDFPLRIIRRFDLRPSLVVINADGFFAADQSAWAEQVMRENAFDAWKLQLEAEAAHRVRRVLHTFVPHYVDARTREREFVIFRSRDDGTWFVATDFGEGGAFAWPSDVRRPPDDRALAAALAFKREIESRGARLVLTIVPAPEASVHRARAMAAYLNVPLIVPDAGALRTIDGSHLSKESAARVAASLLEQLDRIEDLHALSEDAVSRWDDEGQDSGTPSIRHQPASSPAGERSSAISP